LQCVAVCCSVLQCAAWIACVKSDLFDTIIVTALLLVLCRSVLQRVAVCCSMMQRVAVYCMYCTP